MILETERLILRPWKEEDAGWLYEYARDEAIGPAAGWPIHTSESNSRSIINTVLSSPLTFAIVIKEVGHVVGSIGIMVGEESNLHLPVTEGEIGYWIGKPFWGKGYVPEAVKEIIRYGYEDLKIDKLWSGHFEENMKSKRVLEKCGFIFDHINENEYWPLLDTYFNEYIYYIPKE